MGKAQIAITMDMMEREKERKEKTAKIRNELQKANELSEFFKRLQFEEQRIADLKVNLMKIQNILLIDKSTGSRIHETKTRTPQTTSS